MTSAVSSLDIISPEQYRDGYPHDAWTRLRAEAPVCRMEIDGYEPFVAVTKHADIVTVSRSPERFSSAGFMVIKPADEAYSVELRTLVSMDPPEHRAYRSVAAGQFVAKTIEGLESRVRQISSEIVGALGSPGTEGACDFVQAVAAWVPLRVISEMMGIPESDQPDILEMTNAVLGGADAEYMTDDSSVKSQSLGLEQFLVYMVELAADRKACPRDDLASALAHGRVDGEPMADLELYSYYMTMLMAGHDTTRSALGGGLLALIQHPNEFTRLRQDRAIMPLAVEEVLRWTSPVIHFARTATVTTELGGVKILEGDRLALWYPSANRDEDEFENPFEFRVNRQPNRQIAFGIGEHYCLGQALARLELRVLLEVLLDHVDDVELDGPVGNLEANFVGGVKHLPIRYRLSEREAVAQ